MTPDPSALLRELGLPDDRALERPQLERLAAALAAQPALWQAHVDPQATGRTYACLYRDAHLDVWAIFWQAESDTGWHDHDTSSGAVHVAAGALEEHVLLVARPERRTRYQRGATFSFGPSHIHRLTGAEPGAISIHAYSPALWRLGQYSVDDEGALHRVSVSYADELRPLEPPALSAAA